MSFENENPKKKPQRIYKNQMINKFFIFLDSENKFYMRQKKLERDMERDDPFRKSNP